jgi:pilus assembly protein Flp/PilA
MNRLVTHFLRNESGTTAMEYGLIGALISVVCIAGMSLVGTQLTGIYTFIFATIMPALG